MCRIWAPSYASITLFTCKFVQSTALLQAGQLARGGCFSRPCWACVNTTQEGRGVFFTACVGAVLTRPIVLWYVVLCCFVLCCVVLCCVVLCCVVWCCVVLCCVVLCYSFFFLSCCAVFFLFSFFSFCDTTRYDMTQHNTTRTSIFFCCHGVSQQRLRVG